MRLLLVLLDEPVPGRVLPELARDIGDNDAHEYYKALIEVMLRQLQGLEKCRIRFCYAPADADEAIRFWILSTMNARPGPAEDLYLAPSTPSIEQEIDFRPQGTGERIEIIKQAFTDGFAEGYQEIALVKPTCIECGARWINAAFARLRAESSRDALVGPTDKDSYYLLAQRFGATELFANIPSANESELRSLELAAQRAGITIERLPQLSETETLKDWQRLAASPLGPALKKALGQPLEDINLQARDID